MGYTPAANRHTNRPGSRRKILMSAMFFAGQSGNLGVVTALPCKSFAELCLLIAQPVTLSLTREAYFALDGKARSLAKRVRYITPAAFNSSPCQRITENAAHCNLIALDIDDATEAKRLLKQDWHECLGSLPHVVWHTISSTEESPRLRVLVAADHLPVARYADAVRSVAELIGLTSVTHESRVPVQPMFLPTVFADAPVNRHLVAGL